MVAAVCQGFALVGLSWTAWPAIQVGCTDGLCQVRTLASLQHLASSSMHELRPEAQLSATGSVTSWGDSYVRLWTACMSKQA